MELDRTLAASAPRREDAPREDAIGVARTLGATVEELSAPAHEHTRLADSAQTRPPPTRLGRYLIIEPIGAGAMGVVYAAHSVKAG
ncbi:MAG: hypothetical protein H6713_13245 [Myxococcales bacterium]|nr:hypothetical protein [Myxococcales bacterium]MCB9750947.1 hypothetical protein [Myxococcales bacterium]